VVEVLPQDENLQARSLLELEEGFLSRLPLIRRPVVDTNHKIPFVALVSDSYPQIFDMFLATLQGQLFTFYPFLDINGNASAPPSLPVPSEQPVAIDSRTPDMGFVPSSFSKGNQVIAF